MRAMRWSGLAVAICAVLLAAPAQAEVIEEIVAWVDGDIITMSELRSAEQELMQELYRQYTGEELDRRLREARARLLRDLIDRKILLHKAQRLFTDMDSVADSFYDLFKRQQQISDEELGRWLSQSGLTVAEFKQQLVERYAPSEIVRMEVGNRIAVSDAEIEAHYQENLDDHRVPAQVTLREIVVLAGQDDDRTDKQAEAEAVRERAVAEGADFAALAQEVSGAGTREQGGELGPLKKGDLSEKLEELAFSMPVGQVSEVLEMPYGFHIIKVEERRDERVKGLDEVREDLRKQIDQRKYQAQLEEFLETARGEADIRINPKYEAYRLADKS